jgi:hypothetical protein
MEPGTRNPISIEIRGPENLLLHRIEMLENLDRENHSYWLFRLPYDDWSFDDLEPWDSVPIPGIPTLLVMEYTPPGNAPESYQWVMRIILYEEGKFRETPYIRGSGGFFMFRDFNQSGSLEFANTDLLRFHEMNEEGIPLSPYVYRFDGEQYVPVTEQQTWDGVLERYWKDRRAREAGE